MFNEGNNKKWCISIYLNPINGIGVSVLWKEVDKAVRNILDILRPDVL